MSPQIWESTSVILAHPSLSNDASMIASANFTFYFILLAIWNSTEILESGHFNPIFCKVVVVGKIMVPNVSWDTGSNHLQAERTFQAGIFGLEFWPGFQAETFGLFSRPEFQAKIFRSDFWAKIPGQNFKPKYHTTVNYSNPGILHANSKPKSQE